MNHCVPDFEMDDDYSTPTSSGLSRSKKPFLPEDDIMELLWQNGQVVTQSQSQRSSVMRKSSPPSKYDALLPPDMEIRLSQSESRHDHVQLHEQHQHLFMQEDEMVSWLQHPLVDDPSLDPNFSSDLFYPQLSDTTTNSSLLPFRLSHFNEIRPPASVSVLPVPASRPPVPPARSTETNVNVTNFGHFSRHSKATVEFGPSCSKTAVDSCDTPAVGKNPCISDIKRSSPEETSYGNIVSGYVSGNGGKEIRCDVTVISSPGDSSASGEPSIPARAMAASDDRKRKGVEVDDTECQSEDVEFESGDGKKHARGSSTKRSRAAEVHNLSERRRRDRINEKMKALQELIPRCNKSDKASMLDEAIEYLKSLQLQVQMMSMGCGMVPMMFPGMQQYMPPMGMGIGMGMGMGMEMGLNRPIMPFPNVLSGSNMTTPTAAAHHLGPRFPMPAFQMPTVPTTEPLRGQATNQLDYMFQPFPTQNPNQSRVPNFPDPYQQYFGSHQMQLTLQQNPVAVQPSTSKPSSSRGPENPENHQSDSLKEAT